MSVHCDDDGIVAGAELEVSDRLVDHGGSAGNHGLDEHIIWPQLVQVDRVAALGAGRKGGGSCFRLQQ